MLSIPRPRKQIECFDLDEAALTKRQAGIYKLIREGLTVKEIAECLDLDHSYVSREIKKMRELSTGGLVTRKLGNLPPMAVYSLKALASEEELSQLTPREIEVLSLYIQGNSYTEIATELNVDADTAKNHLYSAKKKLGDKAYQTKALNKSPCCYLDRKETDLEKNQSFLENPECRRIIRMLFEGQKLTLSDRRIAATYGMINSYSLEAERAKGLNLIRLQGKKHYNIVVIKPWVHVLLGKVLKAMNLSPIREERPQYPEDKRYKVTEAQLTLLNIELKKYIASEEEYQIMTLYTEGCSEKEIAFHMAKRETQKPSPEVIEQKYSEVVTIIESLAKKLGKYWEAIRGFHTMAGKILCVK
ncbi:MAG: hypothetical protein HPY90_05700 [Syntrophothermus sp.]|uniref:LuxR C-terminal-related transcriptional regulator n=1 Tax=Syntrophothermus sp. TaxID=2736299 RepID=UPI00257DAF17|nr:LuxR C-terminal-related transcriptional regulator [Syntrophothermus sp.]NSW82759.1 hypothetical protein [Syntrophothermus sp.]